jgi:hypothetical protein
MEKVPAPEPLRPVVESDLQKKMLEKSSLKQYFLQFPEV